MVLNLNTVAIIGAGVSGATCAAALSKAGFKTTVYEKSHGIGGRLATRHTNGASKFDHGAQFFTARTQDFKKKLQQCIDLENLEPWKPKFEKLDQSSKQLWFVGKPFMNSFLELNFQNSIVRFSEEVQEIRRTNNQWLVISSSHPKGLAFDIVVCTVPAPQASKLVILDKALSAKLDAVKIAPSWAMLLSFDRQPNFAFDVWRSDKLDISWIARNSSKPGRNPKKENWIIHASTFWSQQNLEISKDAVIKKLLKKIEEIFKISLPYLSYAAAHRWRYAKTIFPLGQPYLVDEEHSLYIGGDWCLGARVECAYESGAKIACDILKK